MDETSAAESIRERWRSLTKEQKISVGILSICGVIAFVLSVQRLHGNVTDPFKVSVQSFKDAQQQIDTMDPAKKQQQEARRRDTDGDGLSDYDEQNVYRTSPYLKDTDGDGAPDNVEIALGENPVCIKGQRCESSLDLSAVTTSTLFLDPSKVRTTSVDELYASMQRGIVQQQNATATSTSPEPGIVRDPAEIRKFLIEQVKLDPEKVKQLSDQTLLDLYDQAQSASQSQQP